MVQLKVGVFEVIASERIENNLGKGERVDYRHFLIFRKYFEKFFFLEIRKALKGGKALFLEMENMQITTSLYQSFLNARLRTRIFSKV